MLTRLFKAINISLFWENLIHGKGNLPNQEMKVWPLLTKRFLLFFTVENNVCYGFVICGLYYVEVGSFYVYFGEGFFFIMNGCGILSKAFSASIEDHIDSSFSLLIWYITLLICVY